MNINMNSAGDANKKKAGWAVIAVIIIAAALLLNSMIFTVREDEIVLVTRFNEVVRLINEPGTREPGIRFKLPIIEDTRVYPKAKMFFNVSDLSLLTSDAISMIGNSFVVWRIDDPLEFMRVIGTISGAEGRLHTSTFSAMQRNIGRMTQYAIISAYEYGRDDLNRRIRDEVRLDAEAWGIEIVDVKIRRFDMQAENEQAVFNRMISDRERLAEYYRANGMLDANRIRNYVNQRADTIVSNARAEAAAIIAEGEEIYMRTLADAYNTPAREEFFLFIRGLEALRKSLSGGDGSNTIILDRNSELARILVAP